MALEPLYVGGTGRGGVALGQGEHLVGHVEPEGPARRSDALGRQQNVYTAARPEVEDSISLVQVRDSGGIAAPERCHDRLRRQFGALERRVEFAAVILGVAAAGDPEINAEGGLGVVAANRFVNVGGHRDLLAAARRGGGPAEQVEDKALGLRLTTVLTLAGRASLGRLAQPLVREKPDERLTVVERHLQFPSAAPSAASMIYIDCCRYSVQESRPATATWLPQPSEITGAFRPGLRQQPAQDSLVDLDPRMRRAAALTREMLQTASPSIAEGRSSVTSRRRSAVRSRTILEV